MSFISKTTSFFILVAAVLLGSPIARAEMRGVQDNGGFFSAAAKSQAVPLINEIERRFRKDLMIETFKELPADVRLGLNLQDKPAVAQAVDKWARNQAKQKRVNGIYILLVKEPSRLQIEVGNDTQTKAFTLQDRDTLDHMMLTSLRLHQDDEALTSAVNFVMTTISSHVPTRLYVPQPQAKAASSSSGWLLKALLIGIVIWVVLRIVRGVAGGGGGYAGGGYPGPGGGYQGGGYGGPGMPMGGGGGGFFSNMLGGMFGAAAGNWMYDKFSGREGSSFSGGPDLGNRGGDSGFSGQDTDFSGTGGDFGGNSGGGDSGGGSDSGGGGDFGGGGDSGGGGGDSGGGGDF